MSVAGIFLPSNLQSFSSCKHLSGEPGVSQRQRCRFGYTQLLLALDIEQWAVRIRCERAKPL
jgi:hypothetical protein